MADILKVISSPENPQPSAVARKKAVAKQQEVSSTPPQTQSAANAGETATPAEARAFKLLAGNGRHCANGATKARVSLLSEAERQVLLEFPDGVQFQALVRRWWRVTRCFQQPPEQWWRCLVYPHTDRTGQLISVELAKVDSFKDGMEASFQEQWRLVGCYLGGKVGVQRDVTRLKPGRRPYIYKLGLQGLADCDGLVNGRCYTFPVRREGERLQLDGTPKPLKLGRSQQGSRGKQHKTTELADPAKTA